MSMNEEILMKSLISMMKTINGLTETQTAIAESLNKISEKLNQRSVSEVRNTESFVFNDNTKNNVEISKKEYSDPLLQEWAKLINEPITIPENVTILDSVPSTHYIPKFSNINKKTLLPNSSPQSGDFVGFGEVK